MRTTPMLLTALFLTAALTAGCSSGGDTGSAESAAGQAALDGDSGDDTGGTDEAAGATGEASAAGPDRAVDLRPAPGGAVIRTAELVVRVDDVRAAADEAARRVRAVGGALEAEQSGGSGEQASASLTLRVPPEAFDKTVADLARLGEERGRQLGTDDVTDQVVDLEARLATQRASVARVRALLDQAQALGEVVAIEGELTKRTADLESLEARLEALTARVDLSTITLRLDGDGRRAVVGDALGFGDGLRGGWSALVTGGRLLAVTLGALLPFLPVALVVALLAWRSRSRRSGVVGA